MSNKLSADSSAPPSVRSKLAIPVLILILAFFGYGLFERSRLIAAQQREKDATKLIMDTIKGNTMSSEVKDWRVMFVPDQPDTAVRVGTIYFPHEGEGPDYTKKVVDLLKTCEKCELVFITEGPFVRKSGGGMFGGAPSKEEKAPEAKKELELLDLEVIRKEFPKLEIQNADIVTKASNRKSQAPEGEKEASKEGEKATSDAPKEASRADEKPAEGSNAEPAKEESPKESGAEAKSQPESPTETKPAEKKNP